MLKYAFPGKYDLIVMRWCSGYLDHVGLEEFYRRAGKALSPSGYLVVVDNLNEQTKRTMKDPNDPYGQRIRTLDNYKNRFKKAGMDVKQCTGPIHWDDKKEHNRIIMWACKPKPQ